MSGILEAIHAQNMEILRILQGGQQVGVAGGVAGGVGNLGQPLAAAQQFQPAATQQTFQAAAPAAVANVTSEMIIALIQPHTENEQIKTALGNAMRQNGFNALGEIPPERYGQMYGVFQGVLAQYGIGAAGQVGGAAAAPQSII